ncbi:hypothetical protein B0T25DRAFT_190884 [Lasiosphaeria hispida]|uniref:Uncharacterized protein n=1 Tax=Lasiosphaeria hispida TaxID=260671 RepID=A0AAJ0MDS7_9PEZI|nr:hypothetical protein B0T25DRAFT_190884 [Lasiosphaeria hispida]
MLRRAQMAQMAQEHARLHAPVHKAMVEAAKARKPSALLQAKVEAQAKAGVAVQNARQWNQARAGAQQATLEAQKMGDVGAVPAQQLPHHQPDNVAPHPGYHELEADMLGDWEDWDGWEQPEQKPNVNAAVQHNQPGLRMAGLPVGWSPQNGAILQEPVLQNGENFTGLHGFIENNRHQGARHDIIDLTGDDDAADHVHAMNPFAPRVHPAVNFYYGLGGLGKGVGNPA